MSARRFAFVLLTALAMVIAGCGERPQVTLYKQGEYKGKPDNLPWQGAPFNGSQADWQKAIDSRTRTQNEYLRIENQ